MAFLPRHTHAISLRSLLRSPVLNSYKSLQLRCRNYTTTASHAKFKAAVASAAPAVFVSRTRDPYVNAELKTRIFDDCSSRRHGASASTSVAATGRAPTHRLFLYSNDPAVLLGRHGNAWCDAVLPLARTLDLPVLRRRSGGSTVAVDAGTMCFASTVTFLPDVTKVVNALPARVTKRVRPSSIVSATDATGREEDEDPLAAVFGAPLAGDPMFGGGVPVPADGISVLVDGPATKLAYDAAKTPFVVTAQDDLASIVALECVATNPRVFEGIVHVNSKLDALNALVREDQRKPFRNVDLDLEVFLDAVVENFRVKYGTEATLDAGATYKETENDNILTAGLFDEIMDTPEHDVTAAAAFVAVDATSLGDGTSTSGLESWEWVYGRTPAFTQTLSFYHGVDDVELEFSVARGRVVAVSCNSDSTVDISRIPTDGSVRYCYNDLARYVNDEAMLECLKDNL